MNNQVKLPIMEIFKRAFLYIFSIKKDLFNGIIIPVIIVSLLEVYVGYRSFSMQANDSFNVLPIVHNLIFVIVTCAFYRSVLQEKRFGLKSFRFGKDELRFLATYILIGAVVALVIGISAATLAKSGLMENQALIQVILLVALFVMLYLIPKFIVLFPNIIKKEKIFDFKHVNDLTKGNNIRILILSILYGVIIGTIFGLLTLVFQKNLLFVFIYYLLGFIFKLIQISIFAHIYKYLSFYNKEENKEA